MCIFGTTLFYGPQDVAIVKRREAMRQASLNADLGCAKIPGFFGICAPCSGNEEVGIGLARPAAEGAEFAADETDVREIDVAVHDVGDNIANEIAAERVGGDQQGNQVRAVTICQGVTLIGAETVPVLLLQHFLQSAPNQ